MPDVRRNSAASRCGCSAMIFTSARCRRHRNRPRRWAALYRDMHRAVRPGPRDVRKQLSARPGQGSYGVIWNAFKRIAAQYSEAEKTALFAGTATDFYRLKLG